MDKPSKLQVWQHERQMLNDRIKELESQLAAAKAPWIRPTKIEPPTGERYDYDMTVKPDGKTEVVLQFNSPGFAERMKWYAQGLQLWREWFAGDPDIRGESMDCVFCGGGLDSHINDCIYIRAKQLIEEADGIEL